MHGLQYIIIVYWYLRRKAESDKRDSIPVEGTGFKMVRYMVSSKRVWIFAAVSLVYAALFQLVLMEPLEVFGFGIFRISEV